MKIINAKFGITTKSGRSVVVEAKNYNEAQRIADTKYGKGCIVDLVGNACVANAKWKAIMQSLGGKKVFVEAATEKEAMQKVLKVTGKDKWDHQRDPITAILPPPKVGQVIQEAAKGGYNWKILKVSTSGDGDGGSIEAEETKTGDIGEFFWSGMAVPFGDGKPYIFYDFNRLLKTKRPEKKAVYDYHGSEIHIGDNVMSGNACDGRDIEKVIATKGDKIQVRDRFGKTKWDYADDYALINSAKSTSPVVSNALAWKAQNAVACNFKVGDTVAYTSVNYPNRHPELCGKIVGREGASWIIKWNDGDPKPGYVKPNEIQLVKNSETVARNADARDVVVRKLRSALSVANECKASPAFRSNQKYMSSIAEAGEQLQKAIDALYE